MRRDLFGDGICLGSSLQRRFSTWVCRLKQHASGRSWQLGIIYQGVNGIIGPCLGILDSV